MGRPVARSAGVLGAALALLVATGRSSPALGDTFPACCSAGVLAFERPWGPDFDPARWTLNVVAFSMPARCVFGARGWQCDQPWIGGVPLDGDGVDARAPRGLPRSTMLRLRGTRLVELRGRFDVSMERNEQPVQLSPGGATTGACTSGADEPQSVFTLVPPADEPAP
jgi:hypothetical protein